MKIEYSNWQEFTHSKPITVYITLTADDIADFRKEHNMPNHTTEEVIKMMIEGGLTVGLGF